MSTIGPGRQSGGEGGGIAHGDFGRQAFADDAAQAGDADDRFGHEVEPCRPFSRVRRYDTMTLGGIALSFNCKLCPTQKRSIWRRRSQQLDRAAAAKKITADSAAMIRRWLTEPRYADYAGEVAAQIAAGKWKELDDVFWTVIPFGTGGRRGKMYPIGSQRDQRSHDRRECAGGGGLCDCRQFPCGSERHRCAIAYDTRHNSRHFAELCAEIMAAAGFKVYFLDGYRSTPELSFAVRHTDSTCGIMVTASHNPPSDNAVKVYWAGGVQVLPPHDKGIIERVMNVEQVRRRPFAEALAAGQIVYCQEEVDAAFIAAVKSQALPGPRELKIIYSPLHGVGASAVLPALEATDLQTSNYSARMRSRTAIFPTCRGTWRIRRIRRCSTSSSSGAKQSGADLVLATIRIAIGWGRRRR